MARTGRASGPWHRLAAAFLGAMALFPHGASADDILFSNGFSNCGDAASASVSINKVNILYNKSNQTLVFDVAAQSRRVQNVTASLTVTAYGKEVFNNKFNPCSAGTFVKQLCPVPAGSFAASGSQVIPAEFANEVPDIAFNIPDISALAHLELVGMDGQSVACITAQVSNGKTAALPSVSYVAAGVAGTALVLTGVSAVGAVAAGGGSAAVAGSSAGGVGTISPSFTDVFSWFQGIATQGMLSVAYPPIYRSFSSNFGFSLGLVPWGAVQSSLDQFRGRTGGNLTADSFEKLQQTTLVFNDGSIQAPANKVAKRAFVEFVTLAARQIETSINATEPGTAGPSSDLPGELRSAVSGVQAYVNQLAVPSANTFMTVLLVVAIVIVAIVVGALLLKLLLEGWALFASFPKSLEGFRVHYWGSISRAITSLILVLYGIWVLFSIYQFTHGDSWAATTLAGVTLALFTGIIVFFSFRIWYTARQLRLAEGDVSGLYQKKDIWLKYRMFYDSYRQDCWWIFVPTIVYLFAKGVCIAVGDGKGKVQTISMLCIEGVMLVLVIWSRPYERKSGNWVNISIALVRFLSVVVILAFVQEFGISQTTSSVAGVVLIVLQSCLTAALAILIAWNAIVSICKTNPHRQRRKEKELEKMKVGDEEGNLTPLDARNSLLLDRPNTQGKDSPSTTFAVASMPTVNEKATLGAPDVPVRYMSPGPTSPYPGQRQTADGAGDSLRSDTFRSLTPQSQYGDDDKQNLLAGAAAIGVNDNRQPRLPSFALGYSASPPPPPPPANNNYGPGNGYAPRQPANNYYGPNNGYAPQPGYGGGYGGGGGYGQGARGGY